MSTATRLRAGLLLAPLALLAGALGAPATSVAAAPPVKEVPTTHIGWEVDATTKAGICTIASGNECQPGVQSAEPGGFNYPQSVAVNDDATSPDYGDVYVADTANHRIQELSASGAFIAMFGWDVNKTKVDASAPQSERNLCTAESKDTCQAGVAGTAPEQLDPKSLAVNPVSGNIFVAEFEELRSRVQELTPTGAFVLEIGKEVNASTKENLCTEEEIKNAGAQCSAAVPMAVGAGAGQPGELNFDDNLYAGNAISVGGPQELLYVGEAGRVQEFKTDGASAGKITLGGSSGVGALAVDGGGDVYLVAPQGSPVIRELSPSGSELQSFAVPARTEGSEVGVHALAIDSSGRLAVVAYEFVETVGGSRHEEFGVLYAAATGHRITGFTTPVSAAGSGGYDYVSAVAFDSHGDLYLTAEGSSETVAYTAVPVAELTASPGVCALEGEVGGSVAFKCTLTGEVNPEGVSETEALFEWGRTHALGEKTALESFTAPAPAAAVLSGLRPNETFYYQLGGYDHNARAPEELQSEQAQVSTPRVAPRILDALGASFASSSSAVLVGELNPENTPTTYAFQYAKACIAGEPCPPLAQAPGMVETQSLHSGLYGGVGVELEATNLQPATSYRYGLVAVNEQGEAAVDAGGAAQLPEATFTTAPAPSPSVASGAASAVGVTSATISGTIDPGGQPATYAFELGVAEGAATHYVVVFSGAAGAGSEPLEEQLQLTGLQPGTAYSYRLAVQSGYVQNGEHVLRGAPVSFTTAGVPAVLVAPAAPALLAVPDIAFPGEVRAQPAKKAKAKRKAAKKPRAKRRTRRGRSKAKSRKKH